MIITQKSDITTLDWYDSVLSKIDAESKQDQFKPNLKWHQGIRDSLTGAQVAYMSDGCRKQIFTNLVNHMRDHLKSRCDWTNDDCDQAEFAEIYDFFRNKDLINGKGHKDGIWPLVWGVYTDYMLNAAKKNFIPNKKGVQIHPAARNLFTVKD